jgi:hypothetical protein
MIKKRVTLQKKEKIWIPPLPYISLKPKNKNINPDPSPIFYLLNR